MYCPPENPDAESAPGTKRVTGEESWTKVKPCNLDNRSLRAIRENLDVKNEKPPELHEVKSVNPNVFIGMDVVKVNSKT